MNGRKFATILSLLLAASVALVACGAQDVGGETMSREDKQKVGMAFVESMNAHDGTIPPTGRQGSLSGIYSAEVKDGRIARESTRWDQVAMLSQLGLMPAP
jgi:hypothetical protein